MTDESSRVERAVADHLISQADPGGLPDLLAGKSEKLHFEIFVAMNEDGDRAYGHSASEAKDLLLENFESLVVRTVALSAAMTPPRVETGPHVDIPDSAGETFEVEAVEAVEAEDELSPEHKKLVDDALERMGRDFPRK